MNTANLFQRRDELVCLIARAVTGNQNASVADEVNALEKALNALSARTNTPKPEPSGATLSPHPVEVNLTDPEVVLATVSAQMSKAAINGGKLPSEMRASLAEQLRTALRSKPDPKLAGRIVSTISELKG